MTRRAPTPATEHRPDGAGGEWILPSVAAILAALVAIVVGRVWLAGTNDPDSMNSVLYFQRIVSGEHLEVTVLTTPKPLLTLLFGASWNVVHDWRMLVWETVAVHALGVTIATRLAIRLAGLPAGFFIATALIASPTELTEVIHANSLPFALTGWLVAGLALTTTPRRFGVAGGALLVAAMARTETWLILGAATVLIAALAVPAVRSRGASWPSVRSALPLLVAWLALPIQWLHDYSLTGNALYTLSVPQAYTALVTPDLQPVGPLQFAHGLLIRYGGMPLLMLLVLIGLAFLFYRRSWAILIALGVITVGVLALLGSLAWRAIYVSGRYYEEPGLGLLFAASIGVGAIVILLRDRRPRGVAALPRPLTGAAFAAAPVLLAILVAVPGRGMGQLISRTAELETASQDLETILPELRRVVAAGQQPAPSPLPAGNGFTRVDATRVSVFVPGPELGRVAVELSVPLTRLGDSSLAFRSAPPIRTLHPGQYVFHDALLDDPPGLFRPLEVTLPTTVENVRLLPIESRPPFFWLLRVGP